MINGIDYSPDGAYLAVGNRDSSMRVWSLHDGQKERLLCLGGQTV